MLIVLSNGIAWLVAVAIGVLGAVVLLEVLAPARCPYCGSHNWFGGDVCTHCGHAQRG